MAQRLKKPTAKPGEKLAKKTYKRFLPELIIFFFAFLLYGNTLRHDYALDDLYAITGNSFTREGISGIPDLISQHYFAGYFADKKVELPGGRYRPLSLVSFAIEYTFFGKNPHAGHFFNILFFALTGVILFRILRRILPGKRPSPPLLSLPFIACLIFIAHPIHTEVVANIKGRDEIFCLLFSLLGLLAALQYLDKRKIIHLLAVFLAFFLAFLSKENALTWIALLPATLYFFKKPSFKDIGKLGIPMVLAALLFLFLRSMALSGQMAGISGELLDNPFLNASFSQKYATIAFTLGKYFQLILFPHPLTWDYYPYHIGLKDFHSGTVWFSILVYITMIILMIWGARKKRLYSYCILFYLAGLVVSCNVFISIGTFMAERFLYQPSVGFAILVAWIFTELLASVYSNSRVKSLVIAGMMGVLLLFYSIKTMSRNENWKDDFTLYTTDVQTSANSAKSNNIAGQWYAYRANQPEFSAERDSYFQNALVHIRKSIRIHPKYQDALFNLGNVYYDYKKDIDSLLWCYKEILKLDPDEENVFRNLTMVLGSIGDHEKAIKYWEEIHALNPGRFESNFYLGQLIRDKDPDRSLGYMLAAYKKQPANPEVLKFLGTLYYVKKEIPLSLKYLKAYLEVNPSDSAILRNVKLIERMAEARSR